MLKKLMLIVIAFIVFLVMSSTSSTFKHVNTEMQVESLKSDSINWVVELINAKGVFPSYDSGIPLICIIDSGVNINNKFILTDNITQIVIDNLKKDSLQFHGTEVAGILISNGINSNQPVGLLPNARILSIQSGNDSGMTEEQLIRSIKVAIRHNAKIINISSGLKKYSSKLKEIIDYADSKGVIIVAAAGNNGENSEFFPAGFKNVISVSNITESGEKARDTNFAAKSFFAPGDYLFTTSNNVEQNDYCYGTSVATPIVTALCAYLCKFEMNLNSNEIVKILNISSKEIKTQTVFDMKVIDVKKAVAYAINKYKVIKELR